MSYKAPDRNAPRFRKTRTSVLSHKFYNDFRRRHPEYKKLSNGELGAIIAEYNGNLQEIAINNRDGVELPEELGYIFVGACPAAKKKNIDHKKSIECGKIVKHRNFESDNKLAKIFYTNYANKYKFQFREIWKFNASRSFSKAVSAAFKENWQRYLQVENLAKISKVIRKIRQVDFAKNRDANISENYNEFAL